MSTPRISVILPVFNAAPFVGQAVRSILDQTFTDFELVIVDDGSTDDSAAEIQKAARGDPRLHLIQRENRGLVATLNEAIGLASADLLARMDADDISLPARFEKQITFLDHHPDLAVVGTQTESFIDDATANPGAIRMSPIPNPARPASHDGILCAMLFRCPLAHPTIMMRRSLFTQHHLAYDPAARHTEDYALWLSAVDAGLRLANLPDTLLRYRIHPAQVCVEHADHQRKIAARLQLDLIRRRLGIATNPEETAIHAALAFNHFSPTLSFITSAVAWLRKLADANIQTENRKSKTENRFPHNLFMRTLTGRFVWLARSAHLAEIPMPDTAPFTPYLNPGVLPVPE